MTYISIQVNHRCPLKTVNVAIYLFYFKYKVSYIFMYHCYYYFDHYYLLGKDKEKSVKTNLLLFCFVLYNVLKNYMLAGSFFPDIATNIVCKLKLSIIHRG